MISLSALINLTLSLVLFILGTGILVVFKRGWPKKPFGWVPLYEGILLFSMGAFRFVEAFTDVYPNKHLYWSVGIVTVVLAIATSVALAYNMNRITSVTTPEEIAQGSAVVKAILQDSRNPLIITDETGKITFWSRAAEETFGWLEAEVLGKKMEENIIPERYRLAHRQGMANYVATKIPKFMGKSIELSGMHKNGKEIPVEISPRTISYGDKILFYSYLRDLTERNTKRMLEAEVSSLHQEILDLKIKPVLELPPATDPGV